MSKQEVDRQFNNQQPALWLECEPAPGLWLEEAPVSEARHQSFVRRAISASSQVLKELVAIVKSGDPVEVGRDSVNLP